MDHLESGERTPAYRLVEGLHLRQWLLRGAVPVAVLCTNGAGPVSVGFLPSHSLPFAILGVPEAAGAWTSASGWCLVALSAWLRVLAKGVLVRKTTLTTGGAYRLVRHPFYLANLVGLVGTFLLAGGLGAVIGLAWLALGVPVYRVTVRGEEEGLGTLYPGAWRAYCVRVPALFPVPGKLGPAPDPPVRVTWRNLVAEREPPRLLRFLAGALLVAGAARSDTAGTVLLVASGVLFVASHLTPRPPSRRGGDRAA